MLLVLIMLDRTDSKTFPSSQNVLLDSRSERAGKTRGDEKHPSLQAYAITGIHMQKWEQI